MHQRNIMGAAMLVLSIVACDTDRFPTSPEVSGAALRPSAALATTSPVAECMAWKTAWIFCDDFEGNRLSKYFEYSNPQNSFNRTAAVGFHGSIGMQAKFAVGQSDAGSLRLAFGKTPTSYIRSVGGSTKIYREVYWRVYVRNDATWTGGGGDKLSRAQSLANSNWAQAMVAPVWSGEPNSSRVNYLLIDPIVGVSGNTLMTTTYNDFAHLKYVGLRQSTTPIYDAAHVGKWYCVEAHAKLNDAGKSNGQFELWIDNQLQASRYDLNWVGGYSTYGINTIFFENYWNNGSPKVQSRYLDNIVVSTMRIGCLQ